VKRREAGVQQFLGRALPLMSINALRLEGLVLTFLLIVDRVRAGHDLSTNS